MKEYFAGGTIPVESWLKYRKSAHSLVSFVKFIKWILLKCTLFRSAGVGVATTTVAAVAVIVPWNEVYMIHMCNYPYVTWFLTQTQNLCLETHNKRSLEEKCRRERDKRPVWNEFVCVCVLVCMCVCMVLWKLFTYGDIRYFAW